MDGLILANVIQKTFIQAHHVVISDEDGYIKVYYRLKRYGELYEIEFHNTQDIQTNEQVCEMLDTIWNNMLYHMKEDKYLLKILSY